jgi:hypothetical protein
MSKFLLNLLLQFSKALLNSKNPILIQKSFYFLFLTFGPAGLPSPTGLGLPAGPAAQPTLAHRLHSCSARAPMAYFAKYVFSLTSRISSASPFLSPPLTPGPHLSYVSSPPSRPPCATAPRAALAAPRDTLGHYRPAPHHSSLNPLQTRA